jgi:hypothetical protein
MYTYIVTSTTSVEIQAPSAGAAAKLVQERPGHVGVVSARMAFAEALTIPVSQYLGEVIEDEIEDHPLHDMAWLGDMIHDWINDAPEAVRAEYDRLVQLLGEDFPLADLVHRSGDDEPVLVAGARVSPDGVEAVIELFVRPGFLNVALAEHEAKALDKALKSGTDYSGDKVRYQRAVSVLAFGAGTPPGLETTMPNVLPSAWIGSASACWTTCAAKRGEPSVCEPGHGLTKWTMML